MIINRLPINFKLIIHILDYRKNRVGAKCNLY